MSLIKKTFILQGQPPKGYLTALKIGATRGVKLNLNAVTPQMLLAVKIGAADTEVFPVRALKEEFTVKSDFDEKTEFRAVVFENGAVYAYTGNSPAIRFEEWIKKEPPKAKPTVSETVEVQSDIQTKEFSQNRVETKTAAAQENPSEISASAANAETIDPPSVTESNPESAPQTQKYDTVYFEPVLKEKAEDEKGETVEAEVVEDRGDPFRFFKKQTESHFYDRVRARVEEMFVVHPKEEGLEKLIPDSKWVRVPYSEDEFYVVGILSDAGRVTHIGYGVKGLRSVFPPKEAEALSEFLPTEGDQGYWLMFQDAETGEMLPIE